MALLNYPSSGELLSTFLYDVRRFQVNSISGTNPSLINVNGEQMYVYIKNLSPAQLSNDNPDIWRIQLPKRYEFNDIKRSGKLFVLLGYDHIRKVYTTWNPYWCKQRLNVAESCSMYSRLSLQKRVSDTQKIEVLPLQNEGEVVCIPSALLASYLRNIRCYFPKESEYIPVNSSLRKYKQDEIEEETNVVAESPTQYVKSAPTDYKKTVREKKIWPAFKLDHYGKLKALDATIIEQLLPLVRDDDYPDYEVIIKQVKEYYPPEATEKMTPADWMKLFNETKWHKKRGRKNKVQETTPIAQEVPNTQNVISEENSSVDNNTNNVHEPIPEDNNYVNIKPIIRVDKKKLDSVFDKKMTSYKYFWFIAIITLVKNKKITQVSFDDILIRMASIAWPIIVGDNIELAGGDMMYKLLKEVQNKTHTIDKATSSVVESSLKIHYNKMGIKNILAPLLNNVPYRFLSPWVTFTSVEDVIKVSREDSFDGPYALHSDGLVINSTWQNYIELHYKELCNFSFKSFVSYAKQFNGGFKLLKLMMKTGWSMV